MLMSQPDVIHPKSERSKIDLIYMTFNFAIVTLIFFFFKGGIVISFTKSAFRLAGIAQTGPPGK